MRSSSSKTTTSKRHNAEQSYFSRIKFDPRLLTSAVAKYISNLRFVGLLTLTIILIGLVSFSSLPKRLNPEVEIPIVTVVTFLPGASPEDVEKLISIPLENEIKSAEGLDTMTSVSSPNVSVVTTQFASTVARDKAKDEVQNAVDSVSDLPDDAQTPVVNALDFEDQPIWTFAVTTSEDPRTLMDFARRLQVQIEDLPVVDRVETSGFEKQEVVVTILPTAVKELGVNPVILAQAVQKSAGSYPAGTVQSQNNTFSVTIEPSITTIEQLRQLRVSVNGSVVQLGDIATVRELPIKDQQLALLATREQAAQRAVTFYVYKTSTVSIDKAGEVVSDSVAQTMETAGDRFSLTTLSNTSEDINDQFSDLLGEFRTTILLVFACLLLFLGLRQAIISSFTVPLTFLSAFALMSVFGQSINFLSLFAFLLALGLLVDDTIVVVSAMTAYYKTGRFSPLQTGVLVWRDTIVPIWSTTLTTIWSFIPLLLTSGIIGEFIKPIPIVVTVTMVSSTAIACLITLPIMIFILKPQMPGRILLFLKVLGVLVGLALTIFLAQGTPLLVLAGVLYVLLLFFVAKFGAVLVRQLQAILKQQPLLQDVSSRIQRIADNGVINVEGFSQWYYRTIYSILGSQVSRRRVLIAITVYSVVSFALLPLGLVKSEFFPKTDEKTMYVNLELPAGTTFENTTITGEHLLEKVRHNPEITYVIAEMGKQAGGFGSTTGSNFVALTVTLPPAEERTKKSYIIAEELRQSLSDFDSGKISVVEQSGGPPAGADVQVQLLGPDISQLNVYADQLVQFLQNTPGTLNVEKSYRTGTSQLEFVPDQTKIAQAGLTIDAIGLWLRTYATGFTLDTIEFTTSHDEKQDVVFRMSDSDASPDQLGALVITNSQGIGYPLATLGSFEVKASPTQITREDGNRSISVSAATAPGSSAAEQNKALLEQVAKLNMADEYTWQTGGANEENQESINSILQAMVISAVLIMVTMVIQFGSFRQAFIVLIVIPLAVSSVFLIFALTGTALSFPALIGVLSLFGIVVTNSMFIVDKINLNQREGMPLREAIADAGASRMEPIILTKLCTVLGLLPITITNPLWRGLGGAIISGLLIASTIMLLFIPTLYYSFFANDKKKSPVLQNSNIQ